MQVVTRDAIHDSPSDKSGSKAALINWALPYAQRYIYSVHPEKYLLFKQSRLDDLKHLQVLVVQKLVYRNVIRSFQKASRKRYKCSCLLQVYSIYPRQIIFWVRLIKLCNYQHELNMLIMTDKSSDINFCFSG